jgi:hypothetical protein
LQTCSLSIRVLIYVYFWIYLPHVRENIQTVLLWVWLTSVNMIISSIHLPANSIISYFIPLNGWIILCYISMYLHISIYHISLIHSSVV